MKRYISLLLLVLAAAPLAAEEERASSLSQEEEAFIESCAENITKKIYSPVKAEECLERVNEKDFELLEKLRSGSDIQASRLMASLTALKDISDLLAQAQDKHLQKGLKVRLERHPCVLCSLSLGPQPEKLHSWVGKYAEGRLEDVRKAGLSWSALARDERSFLEEVRKLTEEGWREKLITDRRILLCYDAAPSTAAAAASAASMAKAAQKYATVGNRLKNAGKAGSGAFLNKTFDNADGGRDGAGQPAWFWPFGGGKDEAKYKLTDEQAALLGPRLTESYLGAGGELSGTKVGEELIAFSRTPAGKVDLHVENLKDHTNGDYSFMTGKMRVSKKVIEKAMAKYDITPEQLMDPKNTAALKKISRYTAPIFVHEYGGHQMQNAWSKANGVSFNYNMNQETDAFSKQSLFVLQKQRSERKSGNTGYNDEIQEWDVTLARKFKKEGFNGVGREILYYEVPSQSGRSAQNFARYEFLKKELTLRQQAAAADPAGEASRDAARPDYSKTALFKQEYDSVYGWYKLSVKRAAEDNAYYQAALNELDKK